MNKRRKLVIAFGAGALAPLAAFAQQQGKVWRVGFLAQRNRPVSLETGNYGAFLQGMREHGYVEDKNLVIEWRFTEGRAELLPVLAAELVRLKVDTIVTTSTPTAQAAQKATTTIPIVMVSVSNPVESGLVKSLARPGGNITGLSSLSNDVVPKQLEMLLRMVPKLSRVAVLVNPTNSSMNTGLKNIQAAADKVKVKVLPVEASTVSEIEKAFSAIAREKADAVILGTDPLFNQQARQIAELAMKNRLASIAMFRQSAEAGVLMSYGTSGTERFRRVAVHVDKILKGAKPGDLPIELPTEFELVINRKTANALGLTIPQSILVQATKVIE
jgi:putative ABC transport system substrate-binding protein